MVTRLSKPCSVSIEVWYSIISFLAEPRNFHRQHGSAYVEILITVTIAAMIVVALMGVVNTAAETSSDLRQRNDLTRQARFAMARMVRQVGNSRRLLLPLSDNPNTNWPENIREQTVPPSAPIGDSTLATAVLAFTLPASVDLDGNAVADADNDADGLIDEDLGNDNNNDGFPGIYLVDDNGDGTVDVSAAATPKDDDDEDGSSNEEVLDAIDEDGDGSVDEDIGSDMNGDANDGIAGVDDDADGAIDEGNLGDDDEDGSVDEDWYDAVVFYLVSGVLKKRTPVPWDANGDSAVNGADFIESDIAEYVTRFRVERVDNGGTGELIDLTLELTHPVSGEMVSLQTRVRLGGAL